MADKFKVYCLGKLGGDSLDIEKRELAGLNVELEPLQARGISEDELIPKVKDADAILGGGGFTRKVMDSMTRCRIIATYSVGFDYVDVSAATDCGIIVVNNPATPHPAGFAFFCRQYWLSAFFNPDATVHVTQGYSTFFSLTFFLNLNPFL